MAKIFATPTGYSITYPVVVFCLAALFLFTAALMTTRITRDQRSIAYVGMGCFALVAVTGVSIIFWQEFRSPTVTITESFEPSDLLSDAASPGKFQLLYRAAAGDYAPYRSNRLSIRSGDAIAFRMDGLSKLVEQDAMMRAQSLTQSRLLMTACKDEAANLVCQQIAALDAPAP